MSVYVCMCVCVYVCMYVYMYIRMYVCMYKYIYLITCRLVFRQVAGTYSGRPGIRQHPSASVSIRQHT